MGRTKGKCVSSCFEQNWKKNFPLNSECGPNHNCCGPCGPHGCRCFCGVTCHGPLCCCPPDYRYFTCNPEPQYPYTQPDYDGAVGGMKPGSCGCQKGLVGITGVARNTRFNNSTNRAETTGCETRKMPSTRTPCKKQGDNCEDDCTDRWLRGILQKKLENATKRREFNRF